MRIRDILIGLLVILLFCLLFGYCSGQDIMTEGYTNGVMVSERIIKLPQDQNKWYISVVGEGKEYKEILGWFNEGQLKTLKDQVHFIPVTPNTPIYKERYEKNTDGKPIALPMVRVQDADGLVVFEKSGNALPMSGNALYNAIATDVNGAEQHPYRDRNAKPNPTPKPDPKKLLVPIFDPDPQPLDDGGAPKVQVPFWPAWLSGTGEDESKVILVGILALLVLLPWRKKV